MNSIILNKGQGLVGKIQQKTFTKGSAAFLDDYTVGPTLYPAVVKLTDKDCWQLYKGNDWILATVDRIVADCVKVEPKVLPKAKDAKITGRMAKRIKKIEQFLEKPNPNKEAFFEIREKAIRDMLIFGRTCLEKVNNSITRELKEIYATSPEYIRLQCDVHGNLPEFKTYILRHWRNNTPIFWDYDEMIYMVHRPISKSAYGLRVLDGIANTVASDILRANYNSNFFINGAEASGIIGLEGMNNKELKKFQTYWRENFRGAKNAYKTAAVNVPVKYVRMAITNRDLEFTEYGRELRMKIFAAFGMQPFMLGIIDQNTGKLNSDQQIQIYKDGALKPVLMKEAYYYTQEIVKMGFGMDDLMISFPSIDLLDYANQANVDLADVNAGVKTINEVRTQRGQGHVPWGDTPISTMPGGGQVDPKNGKLIPPSQNGGSGTTSGAKKKPNKKKDYPRILLGTANRFKAIAQCGSNMKKHEVIQLFTNALPPEDGGIVSWYNVNMKQIVATNIFKGTFSNINVEIDKFIHEEIGS